MSSVLTNDRFHQEFLRELAAMKKEKKEVREPVERELAEAKARRDELAARWSKEKEALQRVA